MAPNGILALDRNEFFFPHPPAVAEALSRAGAEVHRYTPAETQVAFQAEVANHLGIPNDSLVLGHGGEDLLVKIMAWQRRWKSVLILPDFSWNTYAQIGGGLEYDLCEVPCLRESQQFKTPEAPLRRALHKSAPALVILTTPNNPTGHTVEPLLIAQLAKDFPQHLFLIDAVYDVPKCPFLDLAVRSPNVILLGSFSKYFGLPGLRVGYAVSPSLPKGMALVLGLQPFALSAALAALQHESVYAESRASMLRFAHTLLELNSINKETSPLRIFETHAPFVLAALSTPLAEATQKLQDLVVRCGVKPKIFEHQGTTWIRFGLGPIDVQQRIRAFFDGLIH